MLTSSRTWLGLLGSVIAIGYAGWWLAPSPPMPRAVPKVAAPWALPNVSKAQPEKAMATLNKTSLWGKLPEAAASRPLNDPEWRFLGIAANGSEHFVLIKVEGQPEQRLTINDKLPGGGKILQVENDTLCILINGKKRSLKIYKTGPQVL